MYIVAHHFRHNPAKEYEYSHQHQTFDSARLVFISMKYFILVSRPKLGFFHAAVFLAARRSRGDNKRTYKDLGEKRVVFFFVSYHLLITWINDLWSVLFYPRGCFFVCSRCFNVLCLTCNHRYVEEGLFVFFLW